MPNKVLIFESDPTFADALRAGFVGLGCEVAVVDDASVGLQAATESKPDLILLAIELPRTNGFSVCNKLKRDKALAAVPLIILSSTSTDETFDQHRRLRTRAEDYIHKPVSFDALLDHVQQFVRLEADASSPAEEAAVEVTEDDEDLVIDEVEVSEPSNGAPPASVMPEMAASDVDGAVEAVLSERPPAHASEPPPIAIESLRPEPLDAPVDEVIEADEVDLESAPTATDPSLDPAQFQGISRASRPPSFTPSSIPPRPNDSADLSRFREEIERQKARVRELEESARAAHAKAAEFEDALRRGAARDAEVQRLQRDLDEAKAKLSSGKGSGSAREFLDLREQLNKKDKEILELRDQVTHRDKDLLGLKDSSLAIERDKADLIDRVAEMDRLVADAQKRVDAAKEDKDQASKRAEDFKRKAEKLKADLDERTEEIAALKSQRESELAEREAREAALRNDVEEAKRRGEAELEAAVNATEEQGRKRLEEGLASAAATAAGELAAAVEQARLAARAELEAETEVKLAAHRRAEEETVGKLRAEHAQALREAEDGANARLAELKASLERDLGGQLEAAQRELSQKAAALSESEAASAERAGRLEALGSELHTLREALALSEQTLTAAQSRIAHLDGELSATNNELDSFRESAAQRSEAVARLEAELRGARSELEVTKQALDDERGKTERVRSTWREGNSALERAKDALAAALSQVEEAQRRGPE